MTLHFETTCLKRSYCGLPFGGLLIQVWTCSQIIYHTNSPFLGVHGDAHGFIQPLVHEDPEPGGAHSRPRASYHDPIIEGVRPVEVLSEPINSNAFHLARCSSKYRICRCAPIQTQSLDFLVPSITPE